MIAWKHAFASAVAVVALMGAASAQADGPDLVTAPVDQVFSPFGFDDNDNAEVVLHGTFPNTCYKTGPVEGRVDTAAGVIFVRAQAYRYRGGCAQVLVPFTQSVKLGTVPAGTYRVVVEDRPGSTTTPLTVAQARTPGADDYLYAPVAQVALDKRDDGTYAVRLEGEWPFMFIGCMVMREVRAYLSPGNALVVMPIAELVDDGEQCAPQAETHRFVFTQAVGELAASEYLVHVRVLDGNSLNRFVDLSR
jgi:hypothetical protein